MFEVTFNNGQNSGFTDGKLLTDNTGRIVVRIWNSAVHPTRCVFINASNVFPV